jgi:hypothetical protein
MACILWMSDVFFANFSLFLVWADGETHVCFHALQLFQLGSDGEISNFCWLRYANAMPILWLIFPQLGRISWWALNA